MRISDWSSDVCSSDLSNRSQGMSSRVQVISSARSTQDRSSPTSNPNSLKSFICLENIPASIVYAAFGRPLDALHRPVLRLALDHVARQIGRASCRERVCPYV